MPEQLIATPTPEVITTPSSVPSNTESELDAVLSKSFKNATFTEEKNETPKADSKVEAKAGPNEEQKEITIELKKSNKETNKEPKAEEKHSQDDNKALPTPESLDEDPKGKGQAAWTALKNNYKRSFKSIETKDQEITKLKGSLAEKENSHKKEMEALKAEREELSKYRAMVDIQADPEFVSKFDQPIEKSVTAIKEMLKGMDVSDEIINQIDFTNTKLMDDIVGHVGENRDKFVAKKLQRKMEELVDLTDKRNETLAEQKKNYKELLENKKKESFTKEAEGEGRMIKRLENIALGIDKDGVQKGQPIPFLNKMTPKEGATQPEVDQVNNHNKMVELMHNQIKQSLKINTPEDRAELIVAAVGSLYLHAQLKAAITQINSLQTELKKISNVNSETEKVKSNSPSRNGNGQNVDADQALNTFFKNR